VLAQASRVISELDQAPSEELQDYAELIAKSYVEAMTMYSELGLAEIIRASMPAPQAPSATVVEEAPDILTKSSQIGVSIAEKEVTNGLKVEAPFPIPYSHTSVPDHAPRLVGEGKFQQVPKKGVVYEEGQPSKKGTPEASAAKTYEVVATLRQAADKTGIERDEILTTRDIEDEYNINKKLVHEYTRRGREGRPHLTPLSVRLSGGRGGQLLFRREDIEKLVANPPKPGPPKKATIYEEDQTPKTGTPETHERLITLAQASDISGVPVGTLSNYLHEGKLTRQGRQRSPAPGGGKVLIDQSELASFLSSRRPRGRPRKKPATGK
jgi:hypothetical protein